MTSIEWTIGDDGVLGKTWNPCIGCTKTSPGCKHCYAKTMHARLTAMGQTKYAEPFETVRPWPPHLALPLTWKKGRRIFVNSMSDLFHEDMPDEYIAAVFGVMAACPQHTFQILTKRADRLPQWFAWHEEQVRARDLRFERWRVCEDAAREHVPDLPAIGCTQPSWPLPNVWLGVSIEDKKHADRMLWLARVPAAVRFLSLEPLLEDLGDLGLAGIVPKDWDIGYRPFYDLIHWVIVGGESGHGARPFDIDWARSIVQQCRRWDVPVFVKQLGALPVMDRDAWYAAVGPVPLVSPHSFSDALVDANLVKLALRDKKGGDVGEWPVDLRVREFPTRGSL